MLLCIHARLNSCQIQKLYNVNDMNDPDIFDIDCRSKNATVYLGFVGSSKIISSTIIERLVQSRGMITNIVTNSSNSDIVLEYRTVNPPIFFVLRTNCMMFYSNCMKNTNKRYIIFWYFFW